MDVHIGHLSLSGASFLSLPDSSELIRGSHSSVSTQIHTQSIHTRTHTHLYTHKNSISLIVCSILPFSYERVKCLTPIFSTFGLRPAWPLSLTECVRRRRARTHGHPTTVSSTSQHLKNSQMLLQIPTTTRLHLCKYISWEEKRRWLSSGWPRPFYLQSRFHWSKRSPRWEPTFTKSGTTTWQLPWHGLVRNCWHKCRNCHIYIFLLKAPFLIMYISSFYIWWKNMLFLNFFFFYTRGEPNDVHSSR